MQAETTACVWVFTCVRQYEGVNRFGCVGVCVCVCVHVFVCVS